MAKEKKRDSEVKEETNEPQGAAPKEPLPVLVLDKPLETSEDEPEVVRHAELFESYR